MRDYTQTLHLDLPPEEAFDLIVDPETQATRFMKVEAVEGTPEGEGGELRYYYEVFGLRLGGGTYTYSEYVPGKTFTWKFSGGADMLLTGGPVSSTFVFEPADGGTKMTIRPEFKTRIPFVNPVARRIMLWSWKRQLPKWVHEIEQQARPRRSAGPAAST